MSFHEQCDYCLAKHVDSRDYKPESGTRLEKFIPPMFLPMDHNIENDSETRPSNDWGGTIGPLGRLAPT